MYILEVRVTKRYSIAEARQNFAALVHEAERGQKIEVTRRGEPVAVVLSVEEFARLKPRTTFAEVYAEWRRSTDFEGLSNDEVDEIFRDVRDRSAGRDFSW